MKHFKLLINNNEMSCYFRNYINNLKNIKINYTDLPKNRYINITKQNIVNKLYDNKSSYNNYIEDINNINGLLIFNDNTNSDNMLFELGYFLSYNPYLPIFIGNNSKCNHNYLELLSNYKNLKYYNYNNKNDLDTHLYNFIHNIYNPNNNFYNNVLNDIITDNEDKENNNNNKIFLL